MQNKIIDFIKNPILFVFVFILYPLVVICQWSSDPNINTVVCDTSEDQNFAKMVSDEKGGSYVIWTDHRDEPGVLDGDIYAQRINEAGYPVWSENGIAISTGMNAQVVPELINDSAGGFIAVWQLKFGLFYDRDLYAQRVDSLGNLLWNPNGVVISNMSGTETYHNVIPDGNGGAIIAWQNLPGAGGDVNIFAQHIDQNGQILWMTNGITICDESEMQSYPLQAGDDNGGSMITWSDSRNGFPNIDIYIQHVAGNGNVSFSNNGIPVCNEAAFQDEPVIINDGFGNYIVAWYDVRNSNGDIYAQKIDTLGNMYFTLNGMQICNDVSEQNNPAMISDGTGGFIIAWTDVRDDAGNIYAQRVDNAGNFLWSANGIAVCTAPDIQDIPKIISDNHGGAIISWSDYRNEWLGDVYAQRIDSNGNLLWNSNGVALCTASGEQSGIQMISNERGGSIVVWDDTRNGVDDNICAQNVDYMGNLGIKRQISKRTNLNKSIQDFQTTSDTIHFVVPIEKSQTHVVAGVIVFIDTVMHDADGDLTFTLIHEGITDTLIHQAGGTEDDFIGTVLNDGASLLITNGSPPFTGTYLPYQSLSMFDGMDVSGNWILEVYDGITANTGTLQAWGIELSYQDNPTIINNSNIINPTKFKLHQNYPNPFNPITHIEYELSKSTEVKIEIFNVLGKKVKTLVNTYKLAGMHSVDFNGSKFASGVYYYRIKTENFQKTRKMIYMK